jgi:hypothetical protein
MDLPPASATEQKVTDRPLPSSAAMATLWPRGSDRSRFGGLAAATSTVGVDVVDGASRVRWNVFGGLVI